MTFRAGKDLKKQLIPLEAVEVILRWVVLALKRRQSLEPAKYLVSRFCMFKSCHPHFTTKGNASCQDSSAMWNIYMQLSPLNWFRLHSRFHLLRSFHSLRRWNMVVENNKTRSYAPVLLMMATLTIQANGAVYPDFALVLQWFLQYAAHGNRVLCLFWSRSVPCFGTYQKLLHASVSLPHHSDSHHLPAEQWGGNTDVLQRARVFVGSIWN